MKEFIRDFIKRGGIIIFLSTFLGKFSMAFLSIAIVRLVSVDEFSEITYVMSFFAILLVFSGLGGNYSLMRFGSITKSFIERKYLYRYTLNFGTKYASILALIVVLCTLIFIDSWQTKYLMILMTFALISYFRLEVMRSYFRIIDINKLFAKVNVYFSLFLLILTVLLTYLFNVYGYFIALGISPLIIFLLFKGKIKGTRDGSVDVNKRDFWSYGTHTSVSAIANQIIFSIAPLLIASFSDDSKEIAIFKVATIIPFNLLTLPGILMQTDFTILARNSESPEYLLKYYFNYLKVILPISLVVFSGLIYWGDWIIVFLFGEAYVESVPLYTVFMCATFVTYLLRNPLGNILLAVGKAKWNGYNTYVFCFFYIVVSYLLYPILGLNSLVYTLATTFVLSGIVALILFCYYIYNLNNKK